MLRPRSTREPTAYDDDWEGQPAQSRFHKWVAGVLIPVVLIAIGVAAIVTQHATLGRRSALHLSGANAVAIGVAWIAAGVFAHCNYFWGNLLDNHWAAEIGKIVGLLGVVGGLIFALVRNGVLGIR